MHTMWKGTISFGLVNIPVNLHAATENHDIKLRQLHKECETPIKYEKHCPHCEKDVENEEIIKAYEYTKNKFVPITEDELEALRKEKTEKAVEIVDFVKLDQIDPIYFEKSYYLSPNSGGAKAYGLLRTALQESGKIGVAKLMIRSLEQLAVIRVYENTLLVETIHYPDEVRPVADVPNIPDASAVTGKELETAKLLIEQLTTEFDPSKYEDDYRVALMDLIEQKQNKAPTGTKKKAEKAPAQVANLMEALEASIEQAKKDKPKPRQPKRKTASAKTKKTGT
ncbi:Ku protein [Aciduricibacillus chroicocephali]|uniref:Non-homologous end joining protein Ku n=1 Tax=Aciduricibacillus chroicocephali TaxID=3054939 RepID=A0ABY9KUR0_9BACI|nr:Ku protein [Bacillaceae bacterium 44XB]